MSKANSARTKLILFMLIATLASTSSVSGAGAPDPPLRLAAQSSDQTPADPASILSAARLLYVHSRTVLVKSEVIVSELQKRPELPQAGLFLTEDASAADLRMEVRRSNFTTEYPYVVIDARTQIVVASGKVNSLFGTAAAKIAKGFARQLQKARASAGARSK